MNKKGNGIYIFLSIFFGIVVLFLFVIFLYLLSFPASEPLTDEELKELENYRANYNSQVRDNYISGETKEIDYCSFKSMSEEFYLEHNCLKEKESNLINICIPKGIEAEIYLDNSYIGKTNKYPNCLEFEKQYIGELKLKTLWNDYTIEYEEYIEQNIDTTQSYNLISDWEEYKLLLDYVDKISINNKELSILASKLTKYCESGDDVCEINTIFEYVNEDIKYRSDTRATENIKDPFETLEAEAGDCEDQAILVNSLLEQLGHKTFIVFTDDHAFSLVCMSDFDFENNLEEYLPYDVDYNFFNNISPNEVCLYIDPTVTNGYLGYKSVENEDLIAFDSFTKEQILLSS